MHNSEGCFAGERVCGEPHTPVLDVPIPPAAFHPTEALLAELQRMFRARRALAFLFLFTYG